MAIKKVIHISIKGPDQAFISEIEQLANGQGSTDPQKQAEQIKRLARFAIELAEWCQGLEDTFKAMAGNP